MKYELIMLNAFMKHNRQVTKYQSYFKKEAQKAKRDNFVELEEFLNECIEVTDSYKEAIEKQFKNFLNEKDQLISTLKNALNRGVVRDKSGNLLKEEIETLEKDRDRVFAAGYENNYDYQCFLSPTGEIAKSIWDCSIERSLFWRDILQLESAVTDAISELIRDRSLLKHEMNPSSGNSQANKLTEINNTQKVQAKVFILNSSQIVDLKRNYDFWLEKEYDEDKNKDNLKNIFKGYSFDNYINMISNYDFTKVYKRGQKGRVEYNITIIARVMGEDWGKLAANILHCEYANLNKNSNFDEYDELKNMYLHPSP